VVLRTDHPAVFRTHTGQHETAVPAFVGVRSGNDHYALLLVTEHQAGSAGVSALRRSRVQELEARPSWWL
jgi:hypothetical protein